MKNTTKQETKRFSLYSPPELLKKLGKKAEENRRSLNSEMLYAIEQYLAQQKQQ